MSHNFNFLIFCLFPVLLIPGRKLTAQPGSVKTGLEVLIESRFEILRNKRVGLITNPTGVDRELRSTIDLFYDAPEVNLVALFGPEHGVRGNFGAGEKVYSSTDFKTGLPTYSLYGKFRKPDPDMLKGIDVLVYDIQDTGCRSYTYISTLGLAMEAAAELGIEFIVLDRPNPLGGLKIEGPAAEQELLSFVGAYPIPYVYGLTCGELARMIQAEGWMNNGVRGPLKVVEMEGWKRSMNYTDIGLPWVPSSPHIPHAETVACNVATGILGELGVINIGVGYTLPFELMATDFLNPDLLLEDLNNYYKGNVLFRPISFKAYYGKDTGKNLHGVQLFIRNPAEVDLMSIQFKFLEALHKIYPTWDIATLSRDRYPMFDKVCGTRQVRELFFKKFRYSDLEPLMHKDTERFREKSRTYYLYD